MDDVILCHGSRLGGQDGGDVCRLAVKGEKFHHKGLAPRMDMYDGSNIAGLQIHAFVAGNICGKRYFSMFFKRHFASCVA